MNVLVCENNIWGIYSAVYAVWEMKLDKDNIEIISSNEYEYSLFANYIKITSDEVKANKVMNTIYDKFGGRLLKMLTYAIWSEDESKGTAVYKTIEYALKCYNNTQMTKAAVCIKNGQKVLKNIDKDLTKPYIRKINDLHKKVYFELDHYFGFIRFSELSNGVLFSQIKPKAYLLEGLAEHFTDRFPCENWIIYDVSRKTAVFHLKNKKWVLSENIDIDTNKLTDDLSEHEKEFRNLWKQFFNSISIDERENKDLQRNNLPLRFREYMTEFN